jgi:fatty acid CoA ligase FadD36
VQTRLVDECGAELPADGAAIGELQVRGGTLFDRYLHDPATTAARLGPGGWFRTGDLAIIEPDGWHQIVGAAFADLIETDGHRVAAGEVERTLLCHPAVRDAVVVGTPDPRLGRRVTAFVVADGADAQLLVDFVARRLSPEKRPRRLHLLDEIPRDAAGRVRRDLLT